MEVRDSCHQDSGDFCRSGKLLGDLRWEGAYFDGSWVPTSRRADVFDKASGAQLASISAGEAALVPRLTDKALKAQAQWGATSVELRAALLRRAAAILREHTDEICGWIIRESGGIKAKAMGEIGATLAEMEHNASQYIHSKGEILPTSDPEEFSAALRIPLGLVGVITPWNVPLFLAMRSIGPALIAGNAVFLKPDLQTSISGGVLLARIFEEAGLPEGVLIMMPGGADVGEALVTADAVRMVTFTGSTAVGRRVGELAGRHIKKVALELGGNNPYVVLDDCDLDRAVAAGAWASFAHQGQVCMAAGRHIVHRKIAKEYIAALTHKASILAIGDPYVNDVAIGPLINMKQCEKVHKIVEATIAAGAILEFGGRHNGPFYTPTVLSGVTRTMPAFTEEIFGPVAPVVIAEDDEHAIELANDTAYGLSAAVQTGSLERGLSVVKRLRAGMVHVNDQTFGDVPQCPMGGVGLSGNGARFGGLNLWEEFTEWRWMTIRSKSPLYP